MTPDDIIHTAPAIAKGAAAIGAAIPFTGILKRLLGPAVDELAGQLALEVRRCRYGRQLPMLQDTRRKKCQTLLITAA